MFADGDEDFRRDAIAPLGRALAFLMNGEALGEPAGHAAAGGSNDKYVTHFVPHGRPPIEVAGLAARGAVHGDDATEGDAERAEAGHAKRAYGEVFVVRVDLNLHGAGEVHAVLLFVGGEDGVQLRLHVGLKQGGPRPCRA